MPANKVSVIIPCYWATEELIDMTKDCLQSLANYTDQPVETIVVDDGSPLRPDFTAYLAANNSFVCLRKNQGYSAASNAGLAKALGDILIVSNNDIIFTPGWLEGLLKPLEDHDISSIRTTDSSGWEVEDKITEGDKFGAIFAMKRQVYETIGGFDERFRGYFSDLDYKKRAEDAGFRVAKNHAILVEHRSKSTYKQTDSSDSEYLAGRDLFKEKWGRVW